MDERAHYPIVIVQDRYSGGWVAVSKHDTIEIVASGAQWSRFGIVVDEAMGGDPDAMVFWADAPGWVAVGKTPAEALAALLELEAI